MPMDPLSQQAVQKPGDIFSQQEIRQFSRRSNIKGVLLVAHCWATILLVWVICSLWPHPLTIMVAMLVVGSRQLGLVILSHDAAHHLLLTSRRANDWVAEWLLNRPLLEASVVPYRQYHFAHHRYTQQSADPDLSLSAPFPTTRSSMKRKFFRDLTGQTGWKQHSATIREAFTATDGDAIDWSAGLRRLGPNLLINSVFLAGFWLAGQAYLYLLLWVVPYLTWELLVARIRNIGEHGVVNDNDDRLRNARTTLVNPLERLLLAPYYVNYHLEHHLLMSCPCYNLPKAHQCLIEKGMGPRMEIQQGYLEILRLATSIREPAKSA